MPTPRRRFLPAVLLLVLLAGFAAGLARLLELRLSGGDLFPPYSTLRTDALGAKALHDALAGLPEVRVERGYRAWRRQFAPGFAVAGGRAAPEVAPLGQTTLFIVGLDPERWPYLFQRDELDALEDLARRGLRVVLTFRPLKSVPTTQSLRHQREAEEEKLENTLEERERLRRGGDPKASPEAKEKTGDERKQLEELRRQLAVTSPADASKLWGLDFYRVRLDGRGKLPDRFQPPPNPSVATPAAGAENRVGPETVSWHSAADWDADLPDAKAPAGIWRALLRRNRGRAVLVERPFGEGSLALATDSFFLSNEALAGDDRHAALLASLVGPRTRRVVFDERHLGVTENPGMMTLVRRYGLDGALAALGLLVGLFLWRNATSLAPPRPEPVDDDQRSGGAEGVTGRKASAGFGALLRRGVPAKELVPTLLARWESSASARPRPTPSAARAARLREIAAAERARPAAAYRAMRAALK